MTTPASAAPPTAGNFHSSGLRQKGLRIPAPQRFDPALDGKALLDFVVDRRSGQISEIATIKFDIEHRVRAVYRRQLGVAGANGGYTYVALFYRNNRLYQVVGNAFVAGGQAEVDAMRFQQSLNLT